MKSSVMITLVICLTVVLNACGNVGLPESTLETQNFGTTGLDGTGSVSVFQGTTFVGGFTTGSLGGTGVVDTDGDAFVKAFNPSLLKSSNNWTRQFGTPAEDNVRGLATFGLSKLLPGSLYVLGETYGELGTYVGEPTPNYRSQDVYLRKYTTTGTLVWTRQFGSGTVDYAHHVAVDSAGNIWTMTSGGYDDQTKFHKWSPSGEMLTTFKIEGGEGITFEIAASKIFALIATRSTTTLQDIIIRGYEFSGVVASNLTVLGTSSDDYAYDLAMGVAGTMYITGRQTFNANPTFIKKFSATGQLEWTRSSGSASTGFGDIVVDGSGNVFVTGSTRVALTGFTNNGDADVIALKYSATGTRLWSQQFGGTSTDVGVNLALGSSLNVVGTSWSPSLLNDTGPGGGDAYLVKIDAGTGAILSVF